MSIKLGDSLPNLNVTTSQHGDVNLSRFKGRALLLYFYPKDSTPGCTTQGQAFRDHYPALQKLNAEVLGVSRESVKSHLNFINKHGFPFDLISDPDETLCKLFDVIKEKSMYGKTYLGIERSTFIFNADGVLVEEIRKVKVNGHVEDVLTRLAAL